MSEQSLGKAGGQHKGSGREIFIFDLLLVALNAGFIALIYFKSAALISGPISSGIAIGDALKIFMLVALWTSGNIVLLYGLVKAMRRSGMIN